MSETESPFGESGLGPNVALILAGRVSTTTFQARPERLPAASAIRSVTRYMPSGTALPPFALPSQVKAARPPLPVAVRTAGPGPAAPAVGDRQRPRGAARRAEREGEPVEPAVAVRRDAAAARRATDDRRRDAVDDRGVARDLVGVTGRADGAEYVWPPAVPTSWST